MCVCSFNAKRRGATVEFLPLRFPEQAVVRARAGEEKTLDRSGARAARSRVDNAR